MNIRLLFLGIFLFSFQSFATDYRAAVGARAGHGLGLTGQFFLSDSFAIEGMILSQEPNATLFTGWNDQSNAMFVGMLEFYPDLLNWFGVSVYFGLGGHGGIAAISDPELAAGAVAVMGVQYEIPVVHFVIGLDWMPRYDFLADKDAFTPAALGLNLRVDF